MEIIILRSPQSDDQKYRKSKNSFLTVLLEERELNVRNEIKIRPYKKKYPVYRKNGFYTI